MHTARQMAELARLQARRQQIQRDLAQVDGQLVRAGRRLHAVLKRITALGKSQRRAA